VYSVCRHRGIVSEDKSTVRIFVSDTGREPKAVKLELVNLPWKGAITVKEVTDAIAVRKHYGEPSHMSTAKQLDHLDQYCRDFIALSPPVVMATSDASGRADASPRGDAPGFVAVLDDRTLLIPDRIGNKRADTVLNIMENPHVGLLFMTPGINETLRVNGTVRVTIDPDLLFPLSVAGKPPVCGMFSGG
jgi:PPOX class probable FMN-dependent enzyme